MSIEHIPFNPIEARNIPEQIQTLEELAKNFPGKAISDTSRDLFTIFSERVKINPRNDHEVLAFVHDGQAGTVIERFPSRDSEGEMYRISSNFHGAYQGGEFRFTADSRTPLDYDLDKHYYSRGSYRVQEVDDPGLKQAMAVRLMADLSKSIENYDMADDARARRTPLI